MAEIDWGAVAGAAISYLGARESANAAKSAGREASAAQAGSDAVQRYIYDDQRALNMPAYQRGEWASNVLAQYLGMPAGAMSSAQVNPASQLTDEEWYLRQNPDVKDHPGYGRDPRAHYEKYGRAEGRQWGVPQQQAVPQTSAQPMDRSALYAMFRNQPGYQFGLDEGNKQVQASAAARGGLNSGATLKALMKYGTDYADAKGWQPYINQLQSMAGLSQTAGGQIGSAGQNYANRVGENAWNGAQGRAQSTYSQADAWNRGMESMWKYGNKAYQSYKNGG